MHQYLVCTYADLYKRFIQRETAEYSLLGFTDRRLFWVIAPGIPLVTECRSEQFYCDPAILVSNDVVFFKSFRSQDICSPINMTYSFGVDCKPG